MSKIILGRFGGGRFGGLNLAPLPAQSLVASGRSIEAIPATRATPARRRDGALVAQDSKTKRAA